MREEFYLPDSFTEEGFRGPAHFLMRRPYQ
jgi:hypothetical protein